MEMVSFFATAGRGTEQFVVSELKKLFQDDDILVQTTDGKVFFQLVSSSKESLMKIHCLKTVERIFISIHHNESLQVQKGWKGKTRLTECITSISKEKWTDAISLWRQCQKWNPECSSIKVAESCEDGEEHLSKKRKLEDEEDVQNNVTFRVSCKSSGKPGKLFSSQELCRHFGVAIKHKTGWKPELRSPDIEIYMQLNDHGLIIGLPVTLKPLSNRTYIKNIGLRSTISHIMASLANVKAGDVVLDAMCGSSTILVEAAKSWPFAYYVGSDKDSCQIKTSLSNINAAQESQRIQLFVANVKDLPLRDHSVDAIVTDLPFGNIYGTEEDMKVLYPSIIKSFDRVLQPSGVAVLLTSRSLKDFLIETVQQITGHQCENDSYTSNDELESQANSIKQEASDTSLETESLVKDHQDQKHCNTLDKCRLTTPNSTYARKSNPWTEKDCFYVKLGETHAYICHFEK